MPFQIIRDNLDSVLCDAVVDTSAGSGTHFAPQDENGAGEHAANDGSRTVRIGKTEFTKSGSASRPYVIHIPIPGKLKGFTGPFIVRRGYRRALRIVSDRHLKSAAFPLIGSACDGLPKEAALKIATHEIKRFLAGHPNTTIILVISSLDAFRPDPALLSGLSEYFRFIEEREKQKKEQPIMLNMVSTGALPVITAEDIQEDRRKTRSTLTFPQATGSGTPQISRRNGSSGQSEPLVQKNIVGTKAKPGLVLPFEPFRPGQDAILEESFSQMVIRKIDEKGFRKDSDCYCRANIDRRLFSRIRCDENYHPKKATAVALAIALELNLEETNELLRKAGYSLSHSILFDVIIEYCILQQNYDICEVNQLLFMYDQPLLGA